MKRLATYIIIISMIYSCKQAEFNHKPQVKHEVFTMEKYVYPHEINTVQLLNNPNVENISVSISGMYGSNSITHLIDNGAIDLTSLPASIRQTAGTYQILASINNQIIDKSEIKILAGEITGKSTNYIGPKTTSFEDRQGALITGYFQDSFNNMVDTTLDLQYRLQIDKALKIETIITDHQYFYSYKIKPRNNIRQLIGVKAGSQYSDEMTVIGSSGCPITTEINTYDIYNVADGRQLFTVELDGFFDEDRHQIANGTAVSLLFKSKDFKSTYAGQIINGQVRFLVQNPHLAGRYILEITSCNEIIARSKAIYFKNAVQEINSIVSNSVLTIGPILSELNQIMPDGTPVTLQSKSCPQNENINLELRDGFAMFDLSDVDTSCMSEGYRILINGVDKEIFITQELVQ